MLVDDPLLLRTPIVRDGARATVGFCAGGLAAVDRGAIERRPEPRIYGAAPARSQLESHRRLGRIRRSRIGDPRRPPHGRWTARTALDHLALPGARPRDAAPGRRGPGGARAGDLPRLQLYVQFDRPLVAAELGAMRELVKRRQARRVGRVHHRQEGVLRPGAGRRRARAGSAPRHRDAGRRGAGAARARGRRRRDRLRPACRPRRARMPPAAPDATPDRSARAARRRRRAPARAPSRSRSPKARPDAGRVRRPTSRRTRSRSRAPTPSATASPITFVEGDLAAPLAAARAVRRSSPPTCRTSPSDEIDGLAPEVRAEPRAGAGRRRRRPGPGAPLDRGRARAAGPGRRAGAGDGRRAGAPRRPRCWRRPASADVRRRRDLGDDRARRLGGATVSGPHRARRRQRRARQHQPPASRGRRGRAAARCSSAFAKIYFMLSGSCSRSLLPRLIVDAAGVRRVRRRQQPDLDRQQHGGPGDHPVDLEVHRRGRRAAPTRSSAPACSMQVVRRRRRWRWPSCWARRCIARFEKAPGYVALLPHRRRDPVPVRPLRACSSARPTDCSRFRTQASFDVGFSTAKTILLLGLARRVAA